MSTFDVGTSGPITIIQTEGRRLWKRCRKSGNRSRVPVGWRRFSRRRLGGRRSPGPGPQRQYTLVDEGRLSRRPLSSVDDRNRTVEDSVVTSLGTSVFVMKNPRVPLPPQVPRVCTSISVFLGRVRSSENYSCRPRARGWFDLPQVTSAGR